MDLLCGGYLLDNWKSCKIVFEKQLELNKSQLENEENYPNHWILDLKLLKQISFSKFFEICCGVGSFSQILRKHFENIDYIGCDYSPDALQLAKENWPNEKFFLKNLYDITREDLVGYDVIYLSGVVDIIPDEDLIDRLLKLDIPYVFLSRVNLTDEISYFETYKAYNEIETYKYHRNKNFFIQTIEANNYSIFGTVGNEFLLKKEKS